MSKFLITGGAGFIGSNYCHYVVDKYKDDYFVCLDALTYAGDIDNIRVLFDKPNFKFVCENICNKEAIDRIFEEERFDYVINFAAESHVDNSILNPEIFYKTNVLGTLILLEASYKYKVKRFHQVSTDEVYGELKLEDTDLVFTENYQLYPSSPYSASKAAADLMVLAFNKTYGLSVTISRCSNNYGPYQNEEKLIPKTIINALNDKDIPIYGNGLNVRDWIYVKDHCVAVDLIVRNSKDKMVYNVGGGNEKTNLDLVKLILKELGKDESLIKYVDDRLGHDLRYAIDSSLLRRDLGWTPEFNFVDGIKKTIKWYKK